MIYRLADFREPAPLPFRVCCVQCRQTGLFACPDGVAAANWDLDFTEDASMQIVGDVITIRGTCARCLERWQQREMRQETLKIAKIAGKRGQKP